jgi:FPC/CPF motif-containing protein YcgG
MKNELDLNPKQPFEEKSIVTIEFVDRIMYLKLEQQGYNNHSSFTVFFDSPDDMINLANKLAETAYEARSFFQRNP